MRIGNFISTLLLGKKSKKTEKEQDDASYRLRQIANELQERSREIHSIAAEREKAKRESEGAK